MFFDWFCHRLIDWLSERFFSPPLFLSISESCVLFYFNKCGINWFTKPQSKRLNFVSVLCTLQCAIYTFLRYEKKNESFQFKYIVWLCRIQSSFFFCFFIDVFLLFIRFLFLWKKKTKYCPHHRLTSNHFPHQPEIKTKMDPTKDDVNKNWKFMEMHSCRKQL